MKKLKIGSLILILVLAFNVFIDSPRPVKAADTLSSLRKELNDLKSEKKNNDKKKNMTKAEIAQKNKDIADAQEAKIESENKIEVAKKEIEKNNEKIKEYEAKSKEIMDFYQIMLSDNSYIEFITASSNMTELIMRIDAVEQIINYNKSQLETFDKLIKDNEQKQVDLIKYEKELDQNIKTFAEKIDELDDELVSLSDVNATIEEQIELKEASVKMYENMKCKENETLDACTQRNLSSGGWIKPVAKGRINSLFGLRKGSAAVSSNHSGIDIGIDEGTTVYSATTSGIVMHIIKKSSCGGNQVFVETNIGGKTYTVLYAHLKSISVKVHQQVNANTVIGKSGGYSTSYKHGGYDTCTTGAHLHLSVSNKPYDDYPTFKASLINPPGYPKTKGAWFYSRYQWFD